MMATNFSPERAAAIEHALVAHVGRHQGRKHRPAWTAGLLLAGALVGAGTSAGAFAATGILDSGEPPPVDQPTGQPTPDLPDAVSAPAGVTPGMPVISLLDEPVSLSITEATEVPLTDRAAESTHARVTITAITPGSLTWGTDPDGNNPSARWEPAAVADGPSATAWFDFPLDDSTTTLYLEPSGFSGVVTIQFVAHLPTLFGVNAHGHTYGASGTSQGEPDLILVVATNGQEGYVYREELDEATGAAQDFNSPEEALEWQENNRSATHTLTVYQSDGTTRIGEFRIG